ncbi:M67 family metallopeptidase [Desulfurivibrio dismutans]|uniref:M67 family metallopeptidase n=1 Tax=Desulfurivibrio dismutans TaxID=1398908 RepID=UPI0023D9C823|nr:M67 family metallopeptidase [Desulfurivibrio alkaliphilus]MDF1615085.1 M67 family metallopeptidase [Desulfurivibrio alkaliphilus]
MTLQVEEKVLAAILEHGRREMPNEACGYLATKNGVVGHHFELTNQDAAPDHFTMDPAEQFAAMRRIREDGLEMAAVYHTHPETPARPSEEDIRLAHDPAMVYVIVSLLAEVEPIRAFRINRGEVTEVPIRVLAG